MRPYIISLFIIFALTITGCGTKHKNETNSKDVHEHSEHEGHNHGEEGHNHETEDHEHDHEHEHEGHDHDHDHESISESTEKQDHSDEIAFTKKQAEAVGVQIQTVSAGTFHQIIKTSGQIQTAQGDETTVVATTNGIVTFANRSITDGMAVKSGETLVTISAKNLLDGDPGTKARIAYENATKEYQRAENLVKEQIISTKDFDRIRLQYETAKTTYEAQASNTTANGVRVASPMNGYIKNRLVTNGEFVSVGQPIATISQSKRLQLRAEVSEKYFKYLKSISSANFKPAYDNTTYKLSDLNGRMLSFGKASNLESFFIPVTFEFDNIGDIIPGSYVEVYLFSTPQNNTITIPMSSITEEQGLYYVYLQLGEEEYKKQEVFLGQDDGSRIQVISGLKEGDKVVTKGAYQIKLASISSVMPEGHSH